MSILIVTGIEGARNCAAVVQAQLGMEVEVADGARPRWPRCAAASFGRSGGRDHGRVRSRRSRSHLGTRRPRHPPADQLRPLRRSPAHPRDSLGAAPREREQMLAAAPPPRPSKPSSNPRLPACCFTRSWLSAERISPCRLPKGCAWWRFGRQSPPAVERALQVSGTAA